MKICEKTEFVKNVEDSIESFMNIKISPWNVDSKMGMTIFQKKIPKNSKVVLWDFIEMFIIYSFLKSF